MVDVVAAEEVERFDRQPGRVHRDAEERDALVLLHVGVRPCCEPDVIGVPGERGPGLLAVDDELVAVADGSALQRSEVGAGIGFGVADTEGDLLRRSSAGRSPSAPGCRTASGSGRRC